MKTRKEIEELFGYEQMAPRDRIFFKADLETLFLDYEVINQDEIDSTPFQQIITTLSNFGWYQRQSDTLTRAAAKYLGPTLSQFRKLVAKGRIPFVPVTGVVKGNGRYQHKRFRREDLDRWAANNVVEGLSR